VCLPTPLAPVVAHITPDAQLRFEPLYERQLLDELRQVLDSIPGHDLAIQWDTAMEFAILEGVMPSFLTGRADAHEQITKRLVRLGDAVPQPVELGYHLCYGDVNHVHFKQPTDTSILVEVANATISRLREKPAWLHLPVPRDRSDDAYFEPLRRLELPQGTELYLGVVHQTDGVPGTLRRIAAAGRVVSAFGVATECGFGRRPSESVPALLRIACDHAETECDSEHRVPQRFTGPSQWSELA
jgi:methionine synthase II (cobalamin-independent)